MPDVLLFDEDCGFCTWLAGRVACWSGLSIAPIGSPQGAVLLRDLSAEQRYASMHIVDVEGRRFSGGAAVAPIAAQLPAGVALAWWARHAPRLTDRVYRVVARRRGLLGRLVGASGCAARPG
jgi:predicted DCC family thiol-disulfide oxidoreductase YuxK